MGAVKKADRPTFYPGHTVWGSAKGPVVYVGDVLPGSEGQQGVAVYLNERESNEVRLAWGWPSKEAYDSLLSENADLVGRVESLQEWLDAAQAALEAAGVIREYKEKRKVAV